MKKVSVLIGCMLMVAVGMAQEEKPAEENVRTERVNISKKYESLGQLTYQVIHYYESGQVREMGYTKDGKMHGVWLYFDNQGNLVSEGSFDTNGGEGAWRYWNSEGVLLGELMCWDDSLIRPSSVAGR